MRMRMRMWIFIFTLLSSHVNAHNRSSWDVLEDATNRIPIDNRDTLRESDVFRHYLSDDYRLSSRLERPNAVNKISQVFNGMAYMETSVDMIGMILFGPLKGPEILRSKRDHEIELTPDQSQCLHSTYNLYRKHCGLVSRTYMKHLKSFENMCIYEKEKANIKEALIIACGNIDSPVIDVRNPRIVVTPAPMYGSSKFCERVSVPGISRLNLQSLYKTYRLELLPPQLIFEKEYNNIQICFHRNVSLGLCRCEEHEWISIRKPLKGSLMSPYKESFVDVKYNAGVVGSVTVKLDQVSQVYRHKFLISGIAFLLLASLLDKDIIDERRIQYAKWFMRFVAVIWLFMSSIDTPFAIQVIVFSLTLNYVIFSITSRISFRKTKLRLWRTPSVEQDRDKDGDKDRRLTFHKIPNTKKFSKKEWVELDQSIGWRVDFFTRIRRLGD